jgi:hypothetical protein
VDIKELTAELRSLVEGARSMPMSASAVVNRTQLLDVISRLEDAVPDALARADGLHLAPDGGVDGNREEAERVLAEARLERERLVSETEVFRLAKTAAERELSLAEREAAELRQQADDYVDSRLATFEITLTRTLEAVSRGRARLHGRSHYEGLAEGTDPSEGSDGNALTTPDELRSAASDQGG